MEMTEREQFEAWVDRDKINNCHPMEAALIAWQASRATPADQFPYQKTFDAIAAATSISGGNVSVSVAAFIESFTGEKP